MNKHLKIYTITPKQFIKVWKEKKEDIKTLIDNVDWKKLSMYVKLPMEFIMEFQSYLHRPIIYKYQTLTEYFIEKYCFGHYKWDYVLKYQQLSEEFIIKHKNVINFDLVWRYQKYSEEFVKKMLKYVNWDIVSYTIKIIDSELLPYVKKENNWLYLSEDLKFSLIFKTYPIVTIENIKYIECYKAVRKDYSSIHSPNIKYNQMDHIYETNCDFNYNNYVSYGFGAWTYDDAKNFAQNKKIHGYKILKILVPFDSCCWTGSFKRSENFPRVGFSDLLSRPPFRNEGKLRCNKFKIVDNNFLPKRTSHLKFYQKMLN